MRAKFGATSRDQESGFVEVDSEKLITHEKYAKDHDEWGTFIRVLVIFRWLWLIITYEVGMSNLSNALK